MSPWFGRFFTVSVSVFCQIMQFKGCQMYFCVRSLISSSHSFLTFRRSIVSLDLLSCDFNGWGGGLFSEYLFSCPTYKAVEHFLEIFLGLFSVARTLIIRSHLFKAGAFTQDAYKMTTRGTNPPLMFLSRMWST
jgi:hypothetical protein